jgi:hypothetical protein
MDVVVRSSNDIYDLSGRWVGNTGCPAKSSTKGGHPNRHLSLESYLFPSGVPNKLLPSIYSLLLSACVIRLATSSVKLEFNAVVLP